MRAMTNDEFTRRRGLTAVDARRILLDTNQTKYDFADFMAAEWMGAKTIEKEIPRARFQHRCGVCDLALSECDWGGNETDTLRDSDGFNYCPRCGQRVDWGHDELYDRIAAMDPGEYDNAAKVEEKRRKLEDDITYWKTQDAVFGTPRWYFNKYGLWSDKADWESHIIEKEDEDDR